MARTKTNNKTESISEVLKNFLFHKIRENPDFEKFLKKPLPECITDNIAANKTLREYQERAIKTFIWYFENADLESARKLLFHMATGMGKTLVMACCMLYLYSQWYRKFVFFVSSDQIKNQAEKGFTHRNFAKYLFNTRGVKIFDEKSREFLSPQIKSVKNFSKNDKNIEIIFDTIQGLSLKIAEPRENSLSIESFEEYKVVLLADEAHHLNADTKKKETAAEIKNEKTWEGTINRIMATNNENILLEFTATLNYRNAKIREKYENKVVFKYDFMAFREDGFCKNIWFFNNGQTDAVDAVFRNDGVDPQRRLIIINALVMSEYRKIIFEKILNRHVNPIVLFKSANKALTEKDIEDVLTTIKNLRAEDLDHLKNVSYENDAQGIVREIFNFLKMQNISPEELVWRIQKAFHSGAMIKYNSSEKTIVGSTKKMSAKEQMKVKNTLDDLDNENSQIRAVFIVQALREGWDVLSLYDLVHFDLAENKKVEDSDIQLVGRGARYFPFLLPEDEKHSTSTQMNLWEIQWKNFDNNPFKRKFDQSIGAEWHLVLLETFYYHFVDSGNFLSKLQDRLFENGLIGLDKNQRELWLKNIFKNSETYKNGFVLVNSLEKRQKPKIDKNEEQSFEKILQIKDYSISVTDLSDREKYDQEASLRSASFSLTEEFGFNKWFWRSALYYYKNKFFRFENLKEHFLELESMDDFIENFLPKYQLAYRFDKEEITKLDIRRRFSLAMYVILPKIENHINTYIPKVVGGNVFRPRSIEYVFSDYKMLYVPTGDGNERQFGQINNEKVEFSLDLSKCDWYAYNENYGTGDEKKFVKFIATKMEDLRKKYPNAEIWLVRNELDFFLYSFQNGQKFSPDFILFINDSETKTLYYQCLFEVKWDFLREKDDWKEEALKEISKIGKISFDISENSDNQAYDTYLKSVKNMNYEKIKNLGFAFYTADNGPLEYRFEKDFSEKIL